MERESGGRIRSPADRYVVYEGIWRELTELRASFSCFGPETKESKKIKRGKTNRRKRRKKRKGSRIWITETRKKDVVVGNLCLALTGCCLAKHANLSSLPCTWRVGFSTRSAIRSWSSSEAIRAFHVVDVGPAIFNREKLKGWWHSLLSICSAGHVVIHVIARILYALFTLLLLRQRRSSFIFGQIQNMSGH